MTSATTEKSELEERLCLILKDVEEQAIKFSMLAAQLRKSCRICDTAKIIELSKAQQQALNVLDEIGLHKIKLWEKIVYQSLDEIEKGAA